MVRDRVRVSCLEARSVDLKRVDLLDVEDVAGALGVGEGFILDNYSSRSVAVGGWSVDSIHILLLSHKRMKLLDMGVVLRSEGVELLD